MENLDKDKIDLSDEADFEAFLTDSDAYTIIDKDSPYYRWDITFTQEEMTDAIETVLENRKSLMAEAILVEDETGEFVSADVPELGTVTEIEVTERTVSGVVSKLVIHGSEPYDIHQRTEQYPCDLESGQSGDCTAGWFDGNRLDITSKPILLCGEDRRGICRSWWWIRTWCRDEYLWCRRAWQTGKKLQIYITALFFVC